ncbi:MAG: winged helix-turn-helix domain-containing protein [Acidobacteriota bacterium]
MRNDFQNCSAYRVGEWTVRPPLHRLEGPNGERTVEPKLLLILASLANAQGDVVSKETLVEEVWESHHVAESALTRGVSELRRALGDDAQHPRFIETIPRSGYRLLAPARLLDETPGSAPRKINVGLASALFAALVVSIVAVSIAWSDRTPNGDFLEEAPPLPAVRLAQITAVAGPEAFSDYSPDGSRLVYSALVDGSFELFLSQLTPGTDALQLTEDGQQNVQARWSPDGRWIAFHSMGRDGIWLLPALGGEPRRLATFGSAPAWLPDSRAVVFQSSSKVDLNSLSGGALPPSILWLADLDGGDPIPLTEQNVPPGGHGTAFVSHTTQRIGFGAGDYQTAALYTMKLDGSDLRVVSGAPRGTATFAADDSAIYSTGGYNGENWLWRTPLSPTGEALGPPQRLLRGDFRFLDASPQGDRLIATSMSQQSHLYRLDLGADGEETALTHGTNYRDTNPVVSPDGLQVAYRHRRLGQRDQIWLVGLNGEGNAQLTLDPRVSAHFPTWTVDGRGIYFQSVGSESKQIVRFDLESRTAETWREVPVAWKSLRLSDDGQRFSFHTVSANGSNNVFFADPETMQERQMTFAEPFAGFPLLSPDGSLLAYEVGEAGALQIVVRNLETGEEQQLTDEGDNWPGSFLDERTLAIVAQRRGLWNLFTIDVLTGREVQVTRNSSPAVYYRNPDSSPDGKLLVFERGLLDSDLWEIVFDG